MKWIIWLIVAFVVGYLVARNFYSRTRARDNLIFNQVINKEAGKKKILELINSKHQVTNEDVEKLLGISDATATRYFQELEQEGKVRQVGVSGPHVYYEKI